MKRVAATGLVALALFLYGLSLSDPGAADAAGALRASLSLAPAADAPTGFRQAAGPRAWRFPADFGPHPAFRSEWWYYTGQLDSEDGRRFGYQFTLFRRATAPTAPAGASEWRDNQFYMGHFSISDVAGGRFLHEQRLSRAGAGLAGAVGTPRVHIWLEELDMLALDDEVRRLRLRASMAGAAIDFTLERTNPPLLRGNDGHSQKGHTADEASFYYSIPRLTTRGVLTLDGERIPVRGESWMDHEFFSREATDITGWDWFALTFADGRALSLGWLRLQDGGRRFYGGSGSAAVLVAADGSATRIAPEQLHVEATGQWVSPHSGAVYPSGWRVTLAGDQPLDFTLRPLLLDQELHRSDIVYWEGALQVTGDVTGHGYAELTGYHQPSGAGFFPPAGA